MISCCGFVCTSKFNVPGLTLEPNAGGREQSKSSLLSPPLTPHCLPARSIPACLHHPCRRWLLILLGMVWRELPAPREALAQGAPAG